MYNIATNTSIMNEWARRYPNLPLIFDGVASPYRYWDEPIKVAICLKECVMYESGNPLLGTAKVFKGDGRFKDSRDSYYQTQYLKETGGANTPSLINECKIAQLLMEGSITYTFEQPEHRRMIFRRIAHMELSKIGGTATESEWYPKIIEDNKDLIGKQLSNFDANYYVVCGKSSWDTIKSVINLEKYKHIEVDVPNKGGKMEFWHNGSKTLILMSHTSDIYRFKKQLEVIKLWLKS